MKLLATYRFAVSNEQILRKVLRENVSRLILGADGLDLDVAFADMLTEMVVANVDVFGSWTHLGQHAKLQGSCIVLECLAVDNGRGAVLHRKAPVLQLNYEFHNWNNITQGL